MIMCPLQWPSVQEKWMNWPIGRTSSGENVLHCTNCCKNGGNTIQCQGYMLRKSLELLHHQCIMNFFFAPECATACANSIGKSDH